MSLEDIRGHFKVLVINIHPNGSCIINTRSTKQFTLKKGGLFEKQKFVFSQDKFFVEEKIVGEHAW